jgi:creatinine amidohydrolase
MGCDDVRAGEDPSTTAPKAVRRVPVLTVADATWEEVRDLGRSRPVALLPVGAVEAHGPHLPLQTDVVIAEAAARAAAAALDAEGTSVLLLPALTYTAAPFAEEFPGTISIRPETVAALLTDIAAALRRFEARALVLVNAHLDPAHLRALHAAVANADAAETVPIVFPDLSRKPWALRLTDEFKSGACHAGRFESSIVMAARPGLVRDEIRRALPPNPASISVAIRAGKTTFEKAGGPRAYFGAPAEATVAEGSSSIATLGAIVRDAVREALDGAS